MRAAPLLAAALASLLLAAPAGAHQADAQLHGAQLRSLSARCPGGAAIEPTQVITGEFDRSLQGSYVMVPFAVPAGTTQVRVKYCFDQPESPTSREAKHTLDLGMWDARSGAAWSEADFRGWGGSSHPDVAITPEGFAPRGEPGTSSRSYVEGRTTRGYVPGPIEPGTWAAELGVAAVVPREQGDADGKVAWRVEVELRSDAAFADQPYAPAPYDTAPARSTAGWYAGDVHVHGEHSALNDAPNAEIAQYAFGPAKLDFVTLSDYVTTSGWGEIGRVQPDHPGKLIVRSAEVISYRGHFNNHSSLRYVDHRLGPVHEWTGSGVAKLRDGIVPKDHFDTIHAEGGWTQVNHPTIFPSDVPLFPLLCRGCPWDWTAEQTNYREVDAIEVQTGPAGDPSGTLGPSPFTLTAIRFYEDALDRGARIAAVGSSDSHHAGRTPNQVTQRPIGDATTVVYADELSEAGVRDAVQARHTYVKLFGNDGPDLRLDARGSGDPDEPPAIMGDVVKAARARFTATVTGADPSKGLTLQVVRDGVPVHAVPVTSETQRLEFTGEGRHRWRLQLMRNTAVEALTSPIWLDPKATRAARGVPRGAKVAATGPAWVRLTKRGRRLTCEAGGYGLTHCLIRQGQSTKRLRLKGGTATTPRTKGRASATAVGRGVRVGPDR